MRKLLNLCTAVLIGTVCLSGCSTSSSDVTTNSDTATTSESQVTSADSTYAEAPTYSDRYWLADISHTTDEGFPFNYRTMEDEFGSNEMSFPPMSKDGDSESATTEIEPAEATTEATEEELPSREGMDTLCISGSAEYTVDSFKTMIEDIRTHTDNVICVFDLRQETHGFINGSPVSLYAEDNTGNVGLNPTEVLDLEKQQIGELLGTEVTITEMKPTEDGMSESEKVVDVDEVMTEQELCESQDVQYVRISCTDHLCPEDADVDDFVTAYLSLPEGAWLHFHCAAGVGRTGLFMMMADMLRNPDVSLDDVISRQALLGASDPRDPMGTESDGSEEKVDLLQRFYNYVHDEEKDGFPDTFTEWNKSK